MPLLPRLIQTIPMLIALAAPAAAEVLIAPEVDLIGRDLVEQDVTLSAGEDLRVVLPAQPGTGFAWAAAPAERGLLAERSANCPPPERGAAGAPAPVCFAWTAIREGATPIRFVYRRPWEPTAQGSLRLDLDVQITPAP